MKILMLAGAPGSIDGFRVAPYEAGQEYDLTTSAGARDLAAAFIGAGLAEEVGATSARGEEPEQAAGENSQELPETPDVATAPKPGRKPKAP